jgi:LuxR family maltose regulon positive regulatory protein
MMVVEKWSPARALVSAASLARVWLSTGRVKDATELSTAARSFLTPGVDSPLSALLDGLDARVALLEGDSDRARLLTQSLPTSLQRCRLEARLELAAHDPGAALAALERCDPATPRERLDVLMLRARCNDELRSANADASLADAVDAARLEGFTFAVAEELFSCAPRLGALLRSAPLDDFAVAVLELLEHVAPLPEPAARTVLVEPLTDREVIVLRYLTSRLTMSEIASELYISVNTVRTHTKAVYRKLGVASRQDAVTEAHRLGIR